MNAYEKIDEARVLITQSKALLAKAKEAMDEAHELRQEAIALLASARADLEGETQA